ncbi:hydroxymethylbilane synthase [Parasulfuritortus cantonensis]|uniref:Porphobilinogen deaminase n=1 Tax=Parasulfuritortus cantonensis TaxID=2528202 RepID=A0A4R1B1P4_9PROT|nr:hydroxymethylbilane synthase [Parasulfuritortus cantonensis]TCJ11952.1 hydroxymethylbilane synthase [Parasulfuritortus cantonensis]
MHKLIIATRESQLALWQAHHIRDRLEALHPGLAVELLGMTTQGDQILDSPLSRIGGKGLFVKELEQAMFEGRAHLAVHSLKDVPMDLPEGFELVAIGKREDPRDAFVSNKYKSLAELPPGARVGTSSLRRQAQLRAKHRGLVVDTLRGNVNTRLRKLDEGQYDAIILAAAGLKRLGFAKRIAACLSPAESLPAVGQGALGIEIRAGQAEVAKLLAPLNDPITAACVGAERAMSRMLQGGCQAPIGGYCVEADGRLHLRGFVADLEGVRFYHAEAEADLADAEALGQRVAADLIGQGADTLLAELIQRH